MLLLLVIYLVVSLFMLGVLALSHEVRALPIVLIVFGAILLIPIIIHLILYIHYRNVELIHIQVTKFTSIDFSIFVRDRAALVGTAIVNGEEMDERNEFRFVLANVVHVGDIILVDTNILSIVSIYLHLHLVYDVSYLLRRL